jgi:serine/threonine protein phosphatase 1
MKFPYNPYQRVFRGFDPDNGGLDESHVHATLDNNSGRGGDLVYAEINHVGDIMNVVGV